MNTITYYFEDIKSSKLLNMEEEVELGKQIEKGSKVAFDKMFKSNLRLVIKIAKFYITPDSQLEDLIQEGNIGLIRAIEKYDYRKEVRFATYASWWIKQSIIRSISNKRRAIRLPHRKEERLRQLKNTINTLTQNLNRNPNINEIADAMNCQTSEVKKILQYNENVISLDAEINGDGLCLSHTIADSNYSPDNEYIKNEMITETSKVLEKLKEREKYILKQRFNFNDNNKKTLKSIADDMGISPETVRQIEIRTINKIKNDFDYLKDYLSN